MWIRGSSFRVGGLVWSLNDCPQTSFIFTVVDVGKYFLCPHGSRKATASLSSQSSMVCDRQSKFFTVPLNFTSAPLTSSSPLVPVIYWVTASLTSFSLSAIWISLTPGLKSPEAIKTGTFLTFKSPIRYYLVREDFRTFLSKQVISYLLCCIFFF